MKTRLTIAFNASPAYRFSLYQAQTTRPNLAATSSTKVAVTLFAPKPLSGNNIFKGEKEVWLSDALERVREEASVQ